MLDFETYSAAGFHQVGGKVKGVGPQGKGGLPVVGTPVYVEHPSARILSMAYDIGQGVKLWVPGAPQPVDLLDYVRHGGHLTAWNATFEWWVWNVIGVRQHGWPALQLEQLSCDMAKARRFSLPGKLDVAAKVLGTARKDPEGGRLLQKLTRPHTPTKARSDIRWTPATAWDDFQKLYAYNLQDVVAEAEAAARIPDLDPVEREVWLADQRINARGVQVDTVTLDCALSILDQVTRKYTVQLAQLTGGAVGSVSEVAKFLDWMRSRGVHLPDLTAETVRAALKDDDLPADVRQCLEIREALGSANVKKLRSLRLQVSSDGRLRDQYSYCGADRTGRWSAGGVQLQNITAKGPKAYRCGDMNCGRISGRGDGCPHCGAPEWAMTAEPEWTIEAVEHAIADIRTGSLEHVERIWGGVVAVLCGVLRGLFMAAPGRKLVCVDFSAIEAVGAACLSRCQWRVDLFNTPGACIYTQSASKITGTPMHVYDAYKAEHGGHHPDRKKLGKVAELASGYGGWINAWKAFGADMPDDEIKQAVLAWRDASPEIVEMWGGQYRQIGSTPWECVPELYGLEGMAISACLHPGQWFSHHDISYVVHQDILHCRLPSGRFLYYHRPRVAQVEDRLGRGPAYQLTYEGYNSNPTKGQVGWSRMETFGGRLFENVVQAACRDIQAYAIVRAEAAGYPVVMHTHDEITAEVPDDPRYSVEGLRAIMTERPEWASWWPIKAAGWEHQRYQKD